MLIVVNTGEDAEFASARLTKIRRDRDMFSESRYDYLDDLQGRLKMWTKKSGPMLYSEDPFSVRAISTVEATALLQAQSDAANARKVWLAAPEQVERASKAEADRVSGRYNACPWAD